MEFRTSLCHLYKNPELHFTIKSKSIPKEDIDWLISHIESEVKNGITYKPDQIVQIAIWFVKYSAMKAENYFCMNLT